MKNIQSLKTAVSSAMDTIKNAMKRKGLTLKHFCDAMDLLIDDTLNVAVDKLRGDGMSIKNIAKKLHISDRKVSCILNRKCKAKTA